MKYSNKVLRNEEINPGSKSTKNPHAVSDVNAKMGPRTGNAGTPGKRGAFSTAKESRAPLADVIAGAFGARAQDDKINPKLEPVSANTKVKFKK
jgi:hypothetical protein